MPAEASAWQATSRRCVEHAVLLRTAIFGQLYEPKWDGFRSIIFRDCDEGEMSRRVARPNGLEPLTLQPCQTSREADRFRAYATTSAAAMRGPPL